MNKLLYLEDHLSSKGYLSNVLVGFKFYKMNVGNEFEEQDKNFHHLFFLLNGEARIHNNECRNQSIRSNEFILIPKSSNFFCEFLSASDIIIFTFERLMSSADRRFIQSLSSLCCRIHYDFRPISIQTPLQTFLNTIVDYLQSGMDNPHMFEVKSLELFLLLRGFYNREELAFLFYPIVGKSPDFREVVMENYLKVDRVNDLAKLVGMGRTNFDTKFREEFGMSPHQWILKQKAKHVLFKLADPGNTLSDVMSLYKFNSATHFTRFCKQQFGCTPTELVRQIKAKSKL